MPEKDCSLDKVRNFLTKKKTYRRLTMSFKNSKFVLRPDFCGQYVQAKCTPKLQSKLVLVIKCGFKLICRWENCRGSDICWTQQSSLKIFEQIVTAVYFHVTLFSLLYIQCMKNM